MNNPTHVEARVGNGVGRAHGRPPVLRCLLLFFGMLAVALGLAAASPSDERTDPGAYPVPLVRGGPGTVPLAVR